MKSARGPRRIEALFRRYDDADVALKLKARFFIQMCLALLATIPVILGYTVALHLRNPLYHYRPNFQVLAPELAGFFMLACIAWLAIRGHITIAGHTFLAVAFGGVWLVMFLDRSAIVSRVDTIALAIALMAALPLAPVRGRWTIWVYGAVNLVLLFAFAAFLGLTATLPSTSFWDYLADNIIAFGFATVAAANLQRINGAALDAMSSLNRELTEKHARLQESERRFRTLIEISPEPILLARQGRLIYGNDAMRRLLGAERDEDFVGRDMLDFVAPQSRPFVAANVAARARGGQVLRAYEAEGLRLDGAAVPFEMRLAFVDLPEGEATLAYVHDISERKAAERERERIHERMIQAQKMEAVGTLAGSIAHDFNNMLGGIMGSLDLLRARLGANREVSRETLLGDLKIAADSTARAADLTRRLLTLSRKQEVRLLPLDVSAVVDRVHTLCANSFPKSITLAFHVPATPCPALGDAVQIEQAILNLCLNASHAMTIMRPAGERHGGTLTVTVDFTTAAGGRSAGPGQSEYVRVRVSDDGVGMDEQTRKRLFEPFFTTKKPGEGTGLGLYVTYSVVQSHHGFLSVESQPGRGSTFSLCLPLAPAEARAEVEKAAAVPAKGTGRILIIDDEPTIARNAKALLEHFGYEALTAEGATAGVAAFLAGHEAIDGVILDLSMPVMSGLEVFEKLKAITPGVKVLLSSGYLQDDVVGRALALGVRGFLSKPYTAAQLSIRVKELLA